MTDTIVGNTVLEVKYPFSEVGLVKYTEYTDTGDRNEYWGYREYSPSEGKFVYHSNRAVQSAGAMLDKFLKDKGIEL